MKLMANLGSAIAMVGALILGACTNMPPESTGAYPASSNVYSGYGVLQSIEMVRQGGSGVGVGTIAAGVENNFPHRSKYWPRSFQIAGAAANDKRQGARGRS